MDKINNSPKVSFTSLKPQKRLGEQVLREFRNEMGYLKSSSNLALRINNSEKKLSPYLLNRLREKQEKLFIQIYDPFLATGIYMKNYRTFKEFSKELVCNIKGKGNKANCWEDMMIVFAKLLEKGEKPQNFQMKVTSKRMGTENLFSAVNHFATVFGLKKDAKIEDPKTWGSKAVIVDAWAKIAKPANEALEDLKNILSRDGGFKSAEYTSVPTGFVLQGRVKK